MEAAVSFLSAVPLFLRRSITSQRGAKKAPTISRKPVGVWTVSQRLIPMGEPLSLLPPIGWRRAQRDVPTKKAALAWSNEPEPGHNRGDDLPADDTQLPSGGP